MIPLTPTPFPSLSVPPQNWKSYSFFKNSGCRKIFNHPELAQPHTLGVSDCQHSSLQTTVGVRVISLHAQPRTAIHCCVTGDRDSRSLQKNEWNPNHILVSNFMEQILTWICGHSKAKGMSATPLISWLRPGQWIDITSHARHPGRYRATVCNQERTKCCGENKIEIRDLVRADDVLIIIHNNIAKQSWRRYLVYLLFSTNKFSLDTYTWRGLRAGLSHRNTKPATGVVLNVLVATLKRKRKWNWF